MKACLKIITTLLLGSCLSAAEIDSTEQKPKYNLQAPANLVELCDGVIKKGELEAIKFFAAKCVDGSITEEALRTSNENQQPARLKFLLVLRSLALESASQTAEEFSAFAALKPVISLEEAKDNPLSAFVALLPNNSQLPLSLQMYLLRVRNALGDSANLSSALSGIDDLLKDLQKMSIDDSANKPNAALLVRLIPQVKGISLAISEFLHDIKNQEKEIESKYPANSSLTSWLLRSSEVKKSDVDSANLIELQARSKLAYVAFDSMFGVVQLPSSVNPSASFLIDSSPKNVLQAKLHSLFAQLKSTGSNTVLLDNAGEIHQVDQVKFKGVSATSGLDRNSDFIVALRLKTKEFLSRISYAFTLLNATNGYKTEGLKAFDFEGAALSALVNFSEDQFAIPAATVPEVHSVTVEPQQPAATE